MSKRKKKEKKKTLTVASRETFGEPIKARLFFVSFFLGGGLGATDRIDAIVHCENSQAWQTSSMIWRCFSYDGVRPMYHKAGIMDV